LTVHGSSDIAIAAGFVMVNLATQFISNYLNKHDPRRSRTGEEGFDALAITVVECVNDGSPVKLVSHPPAPQPGDTFHYEQMVRRVAQLYESRFPRL
jgi:hypothetical protein